MASKLNTYTGKLPSRSLSIHPPSGMAGENVPYPKLEELHGERRRLAERIGTLAKG